MDRDRFWGPPDLSRSLVQVRLLMEMGPGTHTPRSQGQPWGASVPSSILGRQENRAAAPPVPPGPSEWTPLRLPVQGRHPGKMALCCPLEPGVSTVQSHLQSLCGSQCLPPAQGARTLAGMLCRQELELVEARRVIKRCSWWGESTPTPPCTYCQEEATRYARETGGSVGSRVDVHTHWYTRSHIHTNSHTDAHTLTRSCIHSQTRRQICTHSNIHSHT